MVKFNALQLGKMVRKDLIYIKNLKIRNNEKLWVVTHLLNSATYDKTLIQSAREQYQELNNKK